MYYIYPRVMTGVNRSATVEMPVEMSATVAEMSATVGECLQQCGNVRKSGEIEHCPGNSRLEIAIHNFA